MTSPPAGELSTVLTGIRDSTARAAQGVDALLDGAGRVAVLCPEILGDEIQAALAELRDDFDTFVDGLGSLLAETGDPVALRGLGSVWADEIGATASRLAGLSTLNGVRADDHWTGAAADAYRNTLPAQQAALTAIKTASDEIDTALNDLANAIVSFWVTVGLTLVGFVVAVLCAAASTTTVAGAPIGIPVAIAAVAAAGAAVTAAAGSLASTTNTASGNAAALRRRLANDTAFPSGRWPRSTTPISGDGSITDGSDTDWHLK